jgi:hypothetical protein
VQILEAGQRCAAEWDHEIARPDASRGRGAAGLDRRDGDAGLGHQLLEAKHSSVQRHSLSGEAQARTADTAVVDELAMMNTAEFAAMAKQMVCAGIIS